VIHEEAQLELRAPSKDHATPETLVAKTLVTGGRDLQVFSRLSDDAVSR
jgi:hypothetical protein